MTNAEHSLVARLPMFCRSVLRPARHGPGSRWPGASFSWHALDGRSTRHAHVSIAVVRMPLGDGLGELGLMTRMRVGHDGRRNL